MSTANTGVPGKNSIVTRIAKLDNAWAELASADKFAEMTLTEFRTATSVSIGTRAHATSLKLQLKAAIGAQRAADEATQEACNRVISSVKASSAHGSNSPLYRAMGFIPKSERKSRVRKAPVSTPPAAVPAAR